LLSNYAGDFGLFFTDGEDYLSFDSKETLVKKCRYYLDSCNEEERKQIAGNGLNKIREAHTYIHRAMEMLGE